MGKDLRFDGRVAIVTGAGQGLGRCHALLLASRGAKVVVNDLGGSTAGEGKSSESADGVVEEIKQAGGEAVANYDSVEDGEAIVKTAMDAFGRVDIVVNNAGILRDKSFKKMSDADWDIIFRVHNYGAYKVTKAAWPIMNEQGYGRVIFTTSAAGIYGNFGQTNYSSAKLSLVGFANTLALEGQRKNILVNTIAPVAASRLTEGLLPPAVFDALKPEYVSPLVAYLCSEESDTTGGLYEVGGGLYSSLRWERTAGKVFRLGREVTPESIQSGWEQINDFSKTEHVNSVMESLGPVIQNVEAGPSRGGNEFIDVDAALGAKYPDVVSSYDESDLALYALGVGAASDPSEEQDLQLVYEGASGGMKALATYAVMPGVNAFLGLAKEGITAPGLNYGLDRVLHGEQYVEVVRPLPLKAKLTTKGVVKEIWDKGKGALVVVGGDSYDEDGDLLIKSDMTIFVRGAGGWGGERGPSADVNVPPERAPDLVVEDAIPANQALVYRLSGDWNPLHADPDMARAFGFEKPILHGLCTFGYAGRRVLEKFAPDGNPDFFKSIKVRFADNVYPGDTLVTEMWKESEQRIVFQCKVKERDAVVISNAAIELFEELPKPKEKKKSAGEAAAAGPVEPTVADIIAAANQYLAANPGIAEKAQAMFQLNLSNPSSVWTIDLKAGTAGPGEAPAKPDATLELADADYVALQKGEADPIKLFSTGKLKVAGDMMSVNKLEGLLKMPFELVLEQTKARGGSGGASDPADAVVEATAPDIIAAIDQHVRDNPGIAEKAQVVFQLQLSEPDSVWTIDLKSGSAGAGETAKPDATLKLSEADYIALQKGEADAMKLFTTGKVKVAGDMMAVNKLELLGDMPFELVLEKAEARVKGGALAAPPPSEPKVYEPLAPKLFDALSKRLREQPSLATEVGAVLQFYVRDPDSKWVVDLKNAPPALKSGETDGATTTITIADADLAELGSGAATPQSLFQKGKLRVDGEVEPAHRLNFLKGLI
jgi:3-hydroxyacyl-CoA dehydrogenase/3a,7a,12a-trihydroxy-5b-cholest-24-enoyl-CoA hydratase